jgi:Zn-dependent protease/CBS domain-containing protein
MHSIFALRHGLKVTEIEFYLFGGVSNIEEEPKTPRSETIIAVVGPVSSLVIGGVLLISLLIINLVIGIQLQSLFPAGYVIMYYLGISNVGLGFFNLLPAFPMDGGRLLRAYLWKRRNSLIDATRTASNVGKYFGYGMTGYGIISFISSSIPNFPVLPGGFWFIILGLFLSRSAQRAFQQTLYEFKLSKLSAGSISNPVQKTIPFESTIEEAIRNFYMKHRKSFFPVERDGEIVGLVHIDDIKDIPVGQRDDKIIGYSTKKIKAFPKIQEDETAKDAYRKLAQTEISPRIVVVESKEGEEIVGFITEGEIRSALRVSELFLEE